MNIIGTAVEKETFTWSLHSGSSLLVGQETVTIKDQSHNKMTKKKITRKGDMYMVSEITDV